MVLKLFDFHVTISASMLPRELNRIDISLVFFIDNDIKNELFVRLPTEIAVEGSM